MKITTFAQALGLFIAAIPLAIGAGIFLAELHLFVARLLRPSRHELNPPSRLFRGDLD